MGVEHKKTRRQKIIADYRHQVYSLENKSSTFSQVTLSSHEKSSVSGSFNKDFYSYTYVLNDVLKTGLLTFCIIAFQLVLFFVLKKHIFLIPNLSY